MIVEGLLNLVKAFLLFLISLLPEFPTINYDSGFLSALSSAISSANTICHLKVVMSCIGVCILVCNVKMIWSVIMWVVRKIPGVS